ncbi:MAG: hypothetical protein ABWY16_19235 [Pedobacter sp.]|uniref:hypothetical protein n=1 Tax=Pedobacter sp. TaxID=1411316 RepID=UPI0033917971
MKPFKYISQQSALLVGLLFLFACNNKETVPAKNAGEDKSPVNKNADHFAFYKDIAIKPGLNFEVVSWGKGVDSIGGYLLLMSDSTKNNYKSLSVEREGIITDAWNMDLDNDGNPELYIELLSKKTIRDLNVYEYGNGGFNKISFPALSSRAKKTYAGNDKYTIKNGELFRSYPIVNSTDTAQKNGSEKMLLYRLRGNTFSIDEITK